MSARSGVHAVRRGSEADHRGARQSTPERVTRGRSHGSSSAPSPPIKALTSALALELATLCDAQLQLVSVIEARWLDHLRGGDLTSRHQTKTSTSAHRAPSKHACNA